MRRTLLTTFLLALIACCDTFAESPPIRIILEGYKTPRPERYLLYEGVYVRATVENTSDEPVKVIESPLQTMNIQHSSWNLKIEGDDVEQPQKALSGLRSIPLPTTTLAPKEKVTKELASFWRLGPGEYEIWVEYDPPRSLDWFLEEDDVPRMKVVSNRFRFEIVPPTGIDADVIARFEKGDREKFETMGTRQWYNSILNNQYFTDLILEEFPSSTYAGWVLGGRPYPQDPEKMMELLKKRIAPPPLYNKRVAETRAGLKRFAQKQIEQLTAYLQIRPDFPDADWMNFRIAYLSLEIGDTDRAKTILEQLVKVNDLPTCFRDQTEALHAFAKEKAEKEKKEQR